MQASMHLCMHTHTHKWNKIKGTGTTFAPSLWWKRWMFILTWIEQFSSWRPRHLVLFQDTSGSENRHNTTIFHSVNTILTILLAGKRQHRHCHLHLVKTIIFTQSILLSSSSLTVEGNRNFSVYLFPDKHTHTSMYICEHTHTHTNTHRYCLLGTHKG